MGKTNAGGSLKVSAHRVLSLPAEAETSCSEIVAGDSKGRREY